MSFDIETAGEIAGIVQISAEVVRFKLNFAKKKVGSDHADDIERVADIFRPWLAQLFPQIRRHVRIMTFHF